MCIDALHPEGTEAAFLYTCGCCVAEDAWHVLSEAPAGYEVGMQHRLAWLLSPLLRRSNYPACQDEDVNKHAYGWCTLVSTLELGMALPFCSDGLSSASIADTVQEFLTRHGMCHGSMWCQQVQGLTKLSCTCWAAAGRMALWAS